MSLKLLVDVSCLDTFKSIFVQGFESIFAQELDLLLEFEVLKQKNHRSKNLY